MRNVPQNMGFGQCPQSTIPTPCSCQIPLSGDVVTPQDCKQHEAEIREEVFDKLNQILSEFLELQDAKDNGVLLLRRKIFIGIGKETRDLDNFIVEWLNQYSQVKVISELLQSYREVDYDKQDVMQIRGFNNHLMEGCNFQSSCKLERFKGLR
ncbi:uncharacterized protein LOC112519668 isoform X2 [Cynara cardunculus var. scolymus]|uniref:Uncharacterized protein n=1 Tax=Cynara cardunculus var. scolymus TaxID=59895 RepID=A0A103XZT4_CYNCS|nr:uncharacterized protein LOC112519668 isoform X2 [Cynara cardunculus var. scolymus]KVH99899.1 hypothetical protein Ccrd_021851 [Cynara cardunculus var. scolymus]